MVGYHYDGNCILGAPLKDRRGTTIAEAWHSMHNDFKKSGASPTSYVLDNEISADLVKVFDNEKITYQLATPYKHNKLAERAIQTYKAHFKAGLATVDPNFPLAEWDRLIPQANITLNLLRAARCNPRLSAYSCIFGTFNFMSTPLAPPGTKVVAHIHPDKRGSWELNGEVGWYVGPSLNHYRCLQCYLPRTREVRHCDTVEFIPHQIPFPSVTLKEFLIQAASDIITILTQRKKPSIPSLEAGDPTRNALLQLAEQLKRIQLLPEPVHTVKDFNTAPAPRVEEIPVDNNPHVIPDDESIIENQQQPPRVAQKHLPTSILTTHSIQPKNIRFSNTTDHKYNLRSKSNPTPHHIADMLYNVKHTIHHIYTEDGKKETVDSLIEGSNSKIWMRSLSNEWGRLAQGNQNNINGTDTIDFIFQHEVPKEKDVTYATFVCDYRPLKEEVYRIRITVGGDRLSYHEDAGSPAANLLETKIILNSTISDAHKGARFMTADIKDHFLATPMRDPEYMRVKIKYFPPDIIQRYHLNEKVTNTGWVYIKIKKGMPGLKQAALLAYEHLKNSLAPYGYYPI